MSTKDCKLIYFPVMAIGEPIRWLLRYGDLNFEDIRLTPEEWKIKKKDTPFAAVPILEFDGKIMHQSVAICRFIAAMVGLTGKDEMENFEIDAAVDSINDLRSRVSAYNKLPNTAPERPALKEILLNETIPFYLERFNKMTESGYFANEKLSWADIFFVALLDFNNAVLQTDLTVNYPNLEKIRQEVLSIPAIANWVKDRPPSEY